MITVGGGSNIQGWIISSKGCIWFGFLKFGLFCCFSHWLLSCLFFNWRCCFCYCFNQSPLSIKQKKRMQRRSGQVSLLSMVGTPEMIKRKCAHSHCLWKRNPRYRFRVTQIMEPSSRVHCKLLRNLSWYSHRCSVAQPLRRPFLITTTYYYNRMHPLDDSSVESFFIPGAKVFERYFECPLGK